MRYAGTHRTCTWTILHLITNSQGTRSDRYHYQDPWFQPSLLLEPQGQPYLDQTEKSGMFQMPLIQCLQISTLARQTKPVLDWIGPVSEVSPLSLYPLLPYHLWFQYLHKDSEELFSMHFNKITTTKNSFKMLIWQLLTFRKKNKDGYITLPLILLHSS